MTIVLKDEALRDLEDIYGYSSKNWSYERADNYLIRLQSIIARIAAGSINGKALIGARAGTFIKHTYEHYVVYEFDYTGQTMTVVRILHSSMDLLRHLQ